VEAKLSVNFVENTPAETEGWAEVFAEDKWIVLSKFTIDTPEQVVGSVMAELCDGSIVELKSQDEGMKGGYAPEEPICVRRLWLVGVTKDIITEPRKVEFAIDYELVEKPKPWKAVAALAGVAALVGAVYLIKKRRGG
jgi:hypothetical protein